jgi:glucose/arabinose dehydrogenase
MNHRTLVAPAVAVALAACGGSGGGGAPPPTPVPPTCTATGLDTPRAFAALTFESPVAMLQPPDDASRWYVVEQGGRILVFENDPAVATADEFADLTASVLFEGEAGLLGMAFHPDFATNGLVYLNYTRSDGGALRSVTSEFASLDGGQTLDAASERVLLTVDKPAGNHNGGQLAFGTDRFLYIGLGDGGSAGDAQDDQSLLGKMLRIDVDARPGGAPYGVPGGPGGNPFSANALCNVNGTGAAACPEIFASGFRNPWRWSFDRDTDELWLGDVGQSEWEEIDLVELGGNYGWSVREGAHCFEPASGCTTDGLTDPVAEYGHDIGFSITGGYVYRGLQSTVRAGRYVFGDFGGMVASLTPDGAGGFNVEPLVEQGCTPEGASGELSISSFAEDLDGELFLLDYGSGQVHALEFTE